MAVMRERKTAWPKLTEKDNYFSKAFCKINCTEVEKPSEMKVLKKKKIIFGCFKEVGGGGGGERKKEEKKRKRREMVLCP